MPLPSNTPDILRSWGLDVREVPGWQNASHGDTSYQALVCHFTSTASGGDMPTHGWLSHGGAELSFPIVQFGLSRSGVVYVYASGLSYHAGRGDFRGLDGNRFLIGIEAEFCPGFDPEWPPAQLDAYRRLCAAILRDILHKDAGWLTGHQDYARPQGRKDDPGWGRYGLPSLEQWRGEVQSFIDAGPGGVPAAVASSSPSDPRDIGVGDSGDDVRELQSRLNELGCGLDVDGQFGPLTKRAVIGFQSAHGLSADGIVGPITRSALSSASADVKVTPSPTPPRVGIAEDGQWGPETSRALQRWLGTSVDGRVGPETVRALQGRLGVPVDGLMGPVTIEALQRLVGANPDGMCGPETALCLQRFLNAQ